MPYNFNNLAFNEVRPTYVGPPVEEIAATREHLTATSRANQDANTLMNQLFADTMSQIGPDETGAAIIDEHRQKLKSAISDKIARGDYAYMGNDIRQSAMGFAGDFRIANRKRAFAEWSGKREAIMNDPAIAEDHKKLLVNQIQPYKYTGDDETGMFKSTDIRTPYKKVDIPALFLTGFKSLAPSGFQTGTSYFYDENGQKTFNVTEAKEPFLYHTVNGKEEIDFDRTHKLMQEVIKNDPDALRFVSQDYVVKNGAGLSDPTKAFDYIDAIVNDPNQSGAIIAEMSRRTAEALAWKKTVNSGKAEYINLGGGQDYINPNAVPGGEDIIGTQTEEVDTGLTSRAVIDEKKAQSRQQVADVLQRVATAANTANGTTRPFTELEIEGMTNIALNGNSSQFKQALASKGIEMTDDKAVETFNSIRQNAVNTQMLEIKKQKTIDELAVTNPAVYNHIYVKDPEQNKALVNLAKKLGYESLDEVPGQYPIDKAKNLVVNNDLFTPYGIMPSTVGAISTGHKLKPQYKEEVEILTELLGVTNRKYRKINASVDEILKEAATPVSSTVTSVNVPLKDFDKEKGYYSRALANNIANHAKLYTLDLVDASTNEKITPKELDKMLGKEGTSFNSKLSVPTASMTITTNPAKDGEFIITVPLVIESQIDGKASTNTTYVKIPMNQNNITTGTFEVLKNHPLMQAMSEYYNIAKYNVSDFQLPGYDGIRFSGTGKFDPENNTTMLINGVVSNPSQVIMEMAKQIEARNPAIKSDQTKE